MPWHAEDRPSRPDACYGMQKHVPLCYSHTLVGVCRPWWVSGKDTSLYNRFWTPNHPLSHSTPPKTLIDAIGHKNNITNTHETFITFENTTQSKSLAYKLILFFQNQLQSSRSSRLTFFQKCFLKFSFIHLKIQGKMFRNMTYNKNLKFWPPISLGFQVM